MPIPANTRLSINNDQERAHKDGTMGWLIQPDRTKEYTLICDYNVLWVPFGRYVGRKGSYFVTFFGKIL